MVTEFDLTNGGKTMKQYSIVLPFSPRTEGFTRWLKIHKVGFETSGIEGGFVYYLIWIDPSQMDAVNSALDEIVWKED